MRYFENGKIDPFEILKAFKNTKTRAFFNEPFDGCSVDNGGANFPLESYPDTIYNFYMDKSFYQLKEGDYFEGNGLKIIKIDFDLGIVFTEPDDHRSPTERDIYVHVFVNKDETPSIYKNKIPFGDDIFI